MTQTIFALSTPYARSGVAVIRLSGPGCDAALTALGIRPLPAPRRASLRRLIHPAHGGVIDEALVMRFPAPHSFTGEDMAELQTHGSLAVLKELLEALAHLDGARPAEPGEFTRRAFFNQRMDLTAAEGLGDLIASETAEQKRQAQKILGGEMRDYYERLRQRTVRTLAHLEAYIDFPDEEIPDGVLADVFMEIDQLRASIHHLLQGSHVAERIRDGINVVILGAPNAGKSSLMNALAKRDIAIVSPTAGTTRDMIEVALDISGFPVVLVDTAGLREARDDIEREGIARALRRAEQADIKIALFDAQTLAAPDAQTWSLVDARTLVLISKCDHGAPTIPPDLAAYEPIMISAKTGEGLTAMIDRLKRFLQTHYRTYDEPVLITRARHRHLLQRAHGELSTVSPAQPLEILCEHLRRAAVEIGKMTGRIEVDELLDEIFSSFCIGK